MSRIQRFVQDSWQELKKVNWPTPQQARNLTIVVIAISAAVGAYIGVCDIIFAAIAKALKAIGYKGDVVIESFTTDVKVIAKAAAIWRRIEPTRNEIAVKKVDDGSRDWKWGASYWGMRKIPVARAEVGGMYGHYMFKR